MRLPHPVRAFLPCLSLLLAATLARAAAPPDPLRMVPEQTDFVIEVKEPPKLVEALIALAQVRELRSLQQVREFYDSTNYHRGQQLLAYLEKKLGARWPDLIDRLAGGGVVIAVKYGGEPAPALLVIQGKDEELMHKFGQLALDVAGQELARQESRDRPEKGTYRGLETVRIGKEFHAAVAGAALLVSNAEPALHRGLDLYLDGDGKSLAGVAAVAEARKLLPPDPLAFAWLNLKAVHEAPGAKDVFTMPRDNFLLTIVYGNLIDVIGRSPFACAGIHAQGAGFTATVRLPSGREGLAPELAVFAPPAGQPGSRPLLKPRNAMASQSFYLDVGRFWEDRTRLFTDKQVKALEDFDKNSGRVLVGTPFHKLLTEAGPYHRIVVARQEKPGYKTVPKTQIPAFAVVVEMRKPEEFAGEMEAVLRGYAALAGAPIGLKLVEEKHGEHTIVGYRFPEDAPLKSDVQDIRFNFSPCFVAVGNQFVVSSTLELGHELVDMLEQEQKQPGAQGCAATERVQLFGEGGADFLKGLDDILLTQAILDQALTPAEARQQVRAVLDLVRRLGVLEIEGGYGAREFHYDVRWTPQGG
jgi:hypothetical protein